MTIAVDFDGTIVSHAYPKIGRELPGAISTLRRLQGDGHRLILWTVREGELLDAAVSFCRERGLEFFAVNENYTGEKRVDTAGAGSGCRKLNADLYIDDRNVGGFPGWEAVGRMVRKGMSYSQYYKELTGGIPDKGNRNFFKRIFGLL